MPAVKVVCDVAGTVFKIEAQVGQALDKGGTLMLLESMKMEIPVEAPRAGVLREWCVAEGDTVSEGQLLAWIDA